MTGSDSAFFKECSQFSRPYFDPMWESTFLCQNVANYIQCLVCKQFLATEKHNIKRHYTRKHEREYGRIQGEERALLVERLRLEASELQMPVSEKKTDEAEDVDSPAAMEEHLLGTPEGRVVKRDKNLLDEDDAYLQKAMKLIDKSVDEHQVFGDFVASELRNLNSDINRKKLKIMIEKAIIEITELEINELNEEKQPNLILAQD